MRILANRFGKPNRLDCVEKIVENRKDNGTVISRREDAETRPIRLTPRGRKLGRINYFVRKWGCIGLASFDIVSSTR